MDIPIKKLLRLLQPDRPADVRAAGVIVLGELGLRDSSIAAEVAARLDDPEAEVRIRAIKASGQMKIEQTLPKLLERIAGGGEEAHLAAEAAAQLGAKSIKALQDLMPRVAPGLRRYIAAALTTGGSAGAEAAGVAVLLDKDPQVASAAAAAIVARVPTLTAEKKASLAEELLALMGDKKHTLAASAELAVVRVLTALNVPEAAEALWICVLPPHGPDVRALALQTVGGWVEKPTKDQWGRLFTCAADPDFRIAAPALMVLNRVPSTDKQLGEWVKLMTSPDSAARRLAIEKIGDRDTKEVASALLAQLGHSDRSLRDAAHARLVRLSAGRAALTTALLASETTEEAWRWARSVAGFAADLSADLRAEVMEKGLHFLEAEDHRADAMLSILREVDPALLRDKLVEQAVALRKKKKYEAAMVYLKTAARDPAIGFPVRLELALCGLKTSAKSADAASRAGDPCLRNFSSLLDQDAAALAKEVEKAKWLAPEDLFYVGFHFVEQHGRNQQFGAELLRLVLKQQPKGDLAKSAKNKLKLMGVA